MIELLFCGAIFFIICAVIDFDDNFKFWVYWAITVIFLIFLGGVLKLHEYK